MLTVPFVPSGAEVETAERPARVGLGDVPAAALGNRHDVPVPILDGARQQCVYAETGRPAISREVVNRAIHSPHRDGTTVNPFAPLIVGAEEVVPPGQYAIGLRVPNIDAVRVQRLRVRQAEIVPQATRIREDVTKPDVCCQLLRPLVANGLRLNGGKARECGRTSEGSKRHTKCSRGRPGRLSTANRHLLHRTRTVIKRKWDSYAAARRDGRRDVHAQRAVRRIHCLAEHVDVVVSDPGTGVRVSLLTAWGTARAPGGQAIKRVL